MRAALILIACLLTATSARADGLKLPDPAVDAESIRLCAMITDISLGERLDCGKYVFEGCRADAVAADPNGEWREIFAHCLEREARAWDEVVKLVYSDVRAGAKEVRLDSALRDAQKKWMDFRSAKCGWKDRVLRGNDAAFNEVTCRRDTNAMRAIELLDDLVFFQ